MLHTHDRSVLYVCVYKRKEVCVIYTEVRPVLCVSTSVGRICVGVMSDSLCSVSELL